MDCGCLVPQVDEDAEWYGMLVHGTLAKVSLDEFDGANIRGTMNERILTTAKQAPDLPCEGPNFRLFQRYVWPVYQKRCLVAVCSSEQYARELFPETYITKLELD